MRVSKIDYEFLEIELNNGFILLLFNNLPVAAYVPHREKKIVCVCGSWIDGIDVLEEKVLSWANHYVGLADLRIGADWIDIKDFIDLA